MKLIVYLKRLMKLVMDPKPVKFGSKGDNVVIEPYCNFGFPENIEIGNNGKIGEGTCIVAQGGCVIKDGTILADKVDIRTANHHYDGDDLGATVKDGKTTYRLRIAFKNASDANGFCRKAKSDGLDCYVAK